MKKAISTACLLIMACLSLQAAKVDTLMVRSESMNKDIKVVTIRPDKALNGEKCPTIYLLHGFSDNENKWLTVLPDLPEIADRNGVIFVCPDGGYNSWYWDSPIVPEYRYETFVAKELVAHIDTVYCTIQDRSARAITGLSMGGHGAFYLAMRHQDTFGNMGSMSGGLDFRPFTKNWNIAGRLGTYEENTQLWDENTVINLTHLLKPGAMNIIFDCGTEDFFYEVNCNLHNKLMEAEIPHDFYVRPGVHNWEYWRNSIQYQILFFNNYFKSAAVEASK